MNRDFQGCDRICLSARRRMHMHLQSGAPEMPTEGYLALDPHYIRNQLHQRLVIVLTPDMETKET